MSENWHKEFATSFIILGERCQPTAFNEKQYMEGMVYMQGYF